MNIASRKDIKLGLRKRVVAFENDELTAKYSIFLIIILIGD